MIKNQNIWDACYYFPSANHNISVVERSAFPCDPGSHCFWDISHSYGLPLAKRAIQKTQMKRKICSSTTLPGSKKMGTCPGTQLGKGNLKASVCWSGLCPWGLIRHAWKYNIDHAPSTSGGGPYVSHISWSWNIGNDWKSAVMNTSR